MVNLKDDESSMEGTQVVRFVVQAQGNSSLQPMVQENNLHTSYNEEKSLSPYEIFLQHNPSVSDRK